MGGDDGGRQKDGTWFEKKMISKDCLVSLTASSSWQQTTHKNIEGRGEIEMCTARFCIDSSCCDWV